MFKSISSAESTRRNFKMEVERLVILGVLEREMTHNGDPHPLHNQKLNQLKYIFQVT